MFDTPILLIVFNRPAETEMVFETIRILKPSHLSIAADGARKNISGEIELCEEVRDIVSKIDWPCEVNRFYREENAGCRKAVSEAITWFFKSTEQGIILEDDCLPDQSFFPFCADLLQKYKLDDRIISIGGTNLGCKLDPGQSYDFSKFMNMWGWATWKRSVDLVDYDMEAWQRLKLKKFFLYKKLKGKGKTLDYNWIKYWYNYFQLTSSGKVDTWDYQWIFAQLFHNKLSIFPAKNLIMNLGFSETATHTFHSGHPVSLLQLEAMTFPLNHPAVMAVNMDYENNYIKKIWFNYTRESLYRILRSDFLNHPFVSKIIRTSGIKRPEISN